MELAERGMSLHDIQRFSGHFDVRNAVLYGTFRLRLCDLVRFHS
jgi:hypothetical protein